MIDNAQRLVKHCANRARVKTNSTSKKRYLNNNFFAIFLIYSYEFNTASGRIQSPADCHFDALANAQDSGFCGWRPSDFSASQIWHTGNAVLVDSANFVVRASSADSSGSSATTATGTNRFAYVQGQFDAGIDGAIESPVLTGTEAGVGPKELKLTYWKVAPLPTLDICVKDVADESLNCVDAITGPGQHQWIRRSVEIPISEVPYKIILRARGILSAEDIICVDDIQLIDSTSYSEAISNDVYMADVDMARQANSIKDNKSHQDEFVLGYYQQMKLDRDQEPNGNNEVEDYQKERHKIPNFADGFEEQGLISLQQRPSVANAKNFGERLRPSIRPQLRQKPSSIAVSLAESPPQDAARSQSATKMPKRHPAMKKLSQNGKEQLTNYPEISSFVYNTGSQQWKSLDIASPEPLGFCHAVKCSFLEDSCLWKLGATWKKAGGSIVRDTTGEDFVQSALFKAPLGSFIEFDLWMSDDSHFMVVEEMSDLTDEHITLFSHRGMSSNGFNRFRVPLRPSFRPAKLRLRSILPVNAFVTVSNTRLVDSRHNEIMCETILPGSNEYEQFGSKKSKTNESAMLTPRPPLMAKPPLTSFADLFTNTMSPFPTLPTPLPFSFDLLTPPTTTYSQLQQLSPDFVPDTTTQFPSMFPTLAPSLALTPPAPIFNPFKPMLESGITPIVPLRDEPPRLTAFQKQQLSNTSTDNGRSKAMSANEAFRHFSSILPNVWPEVGRSDNDEGHAWSPSIHKKQSFSGLNRADLGENQLQSHQRLHDLKPEDAPILALFSKPGGDKITHDDENRVESGFIAGEKRTLGEIIGSIAGQPALEKQLRHLAQQFGFNTNQVPDENMLKKIQGLFGSRLFYHGALPASVSSTSTHTKNISLTNVSSVLPLHTVSSAGSHAGPPPSPFEAPEPSFRSLDEFGKPINGTNSRPHRNLYNFKFEQIDPVKPINMNN